MDWGDFCPGVSPVAKGPRSQLVSQAGIRPEGHSEDPSLMSSWVVQKLFTLKSCFTRSAMGAAQAGFLSKTELGMITSRVGRESFQIMNMSQLWKSTDTALTEWNLCNCQRVTVSEEGLCFGSVLEDDSHKSAIQNSVEKRSLLLFAVVITLRTKKLLKSFISRSMKSFWGRKKRESFHFRNAFFFFFFSK